MWAFTLSVSVPRTTPPAALSSLGDKKKSIPSLPTIHSLSLSFTVTGLYTYMYRPSSPSMRISGFCAPRVCPVHRVYRVFWLFLACGKKVYKRITKPTNFFFFFFTFMHIFNPLRGNDETCIRSRDCLNGVDRSCLVEILY